MTSMAKHERSTKVGKKLISGWILAASHCLELWSIFGNKRCTLFALDKYSVFFFLRYHLSWGMVYEWGKLASACVFAGYPDIIIVFRHLFSVWTPNTINAHLHGRFLVYIMRVNTSICHVTSRHKVSISTDIVSFWRVRRFTNPSSLLLWVNGKMVTTMRRFSHASGWKQDGICDFAPEIKVVSASMLFIVSLMSDFPGGVDCWNKINDPYWFP